MLEQKLEQAQYYYRTEQHEKAIESLKELLASWPDSAIAHGLLASCLLSERRLYAAEHELNIALSIEPNLVLLKLILARTLIFKKQLQQALQACDEALSVEPDCVEALLLQSQIYMLLDKRAPAKDVLVEALRHEPDSAQVLASLGDYHLTVGEVELAIEFALQALKLEPENASANVLMGSAQLAAGNVDDAAYHAKFAILQNPHSEIALQLLADIKARQSWLLGLWWQFNNKVTALSDVGSALVLIGGYLLFNLLSQLLTDFGYQSLSTATAFVWLGIVVYSWVCIPLYYRQLRKELSTFQFKPDF
ncbi:tetratricopeptide repeat protein [Thaumasiovibrio subtropicus]|uniref:tetratricopeptide repeat protein n=1 Tax=Thaumasiovibrio subtropicus TaxID=1891207 RepID=UPI000B355D9E|nr:tetratricopeptide repeat protein [Thaumasiovibrio subtropicus]